MKKLLYTLALIAIGGASLFSFTYFSKGDVKPLEIGSEMPMSDYEMKDISGEMKDLAGLKEENGLLVIFSCNTCPFVIRWESRYPEFGALCEKQDIGMVLVNSNARFRGNEDSFEAMKKHAEEKGYNTPYVVDKNSALADAFGAKTTPHVFLFDQHNKLVYEGSIDDRYENDEMVSKEYLEQAIEHMLAGKKIPEPDTKAIGCSIKRVKK